MILASGITAEELRTAMIEATKAMESVSRYARAVSFSLPLDSHIQGFNDGKWSSEPRTTCCMGLEDV